MGGLVAGAQGAVGEIVDECDGYLQVAWDGARRFDALDIVTIGGENYCYDCAAVRPLT